MRRKIIVLLTWAMFLCLAGCKEKTKSNRPNMEALKEAEVGSYIYFGEYEQDNDASTEKEAIEWLVLDKQEDRMLVISRYGLDWQPYNTKMANVSWETCSLRGWLNDVFFETAFISEEKEVILTSEVTADANPNCDTSAGNDTMDKVFLLSINEANRYFTNEDAMACSGTPYCYAQGAYKSPDYGTCFWSLRTPGDNERLATYVYTDGGVSYSGVDVDDQNVVRPALWIDTSSIQN